MPRLERSQSSQYARFWFWFALVFVSRVPFLDLGYGADADAWRLAQVGIEMAQKGHYICSRAPCYPVPELLYWLLTPITPFWFNAIGAALSAVGAAAFAASLGRLGFSNCVLAGVAMALTPIVYINSTNAMDYVWALAFILISLFFLVSKYPLWAGVFLGVAVGCRITSGAVFFPFALLIYKLYTKRSPWPGLLKFTLSFGVISMILFFPVVAVYDVNFFSFYEVMKVPIFAKINHACVDVWGTIGLMVVIGLLWALLARRFSSRKKTKESPRLDPIQHTWVIACSIAIVLYYIAFFRLPFEAAYLIPTVPFLIGLFTALLPQRFTMIGWTLLILSPFVLSISFVVKSQTSDYRWKISDHPEWYIAINIKGPLIVWQENRKKTCEGYDRLAKKISEIAGQSPTKIVVAAGAKTAILSIGWQDQLPDNAELVYLVSKKKLMEYKKSGTEIYIIEYVNEYNKSAHRVDLIKHGAILLSY